MKSAPLGMEIVRRCISTELSCCEVAKVQKRPGLVKEKRSHLLRPEEWANKTGGLALQIAQFLRDKKFGQLEIEAKKGLNLL